MGHYLEHDDDEHDDDEYEDDGIVEGAQSQSLGFPPDVRHRYRVALADFRLSRATELWPCVAAAVDAAFLLVDPGDVLYLGLKPGAAFEYEAVSARVWWRLCDRLEDGDEPATCGDDVAGIDETTGTVWRGPQTVHTALSVDSAIEIVHEEMASEFAIPSLTNKDFDAIVSAEFGSSALIGATALTGIVEVGRLIHRRVGTFRTWAAN